MYIIISVLAAGAIVLLLLLVRENRLKRRLQMKYDELDQMLTGYVADNLDMEKQLSEMKNDYDLLQEMAEEIRKMQEQSRLLKHDMKNHTMVMLSYFEENRIEEARNYAGEILDKLNKMYTYVNAGNSLLNYIINRKLSEAAEAGIGLRAEIENLAFAYMDGVDFSALLNNLLDNAIEGAQRSEDKKLEVRIFSQNGLDVITVKNSIDGSVLETNPGLTSTKDTPGHGHGIRQIRSMTEKYNGEIDIYEKDHMFVVSILLGESCLSQQ